MKDERSKRGGRGRFKFSQSLKPAPQTFQSDTNQFDSGPSPSPQSRASQISVPECESTIPMPMRILIAALIYGVARVVTFVGLCALSDSCTGNSDLSWLQYLWGTLFNFGLAAMAGVLVSIAIFGFLSVLPLGRSKVFQVGGAIGSGIVGLFPEALIFLALNGDSFTNVLNWGGYEFGSVLSGIACGTYLLLSRPTAQRPLA